MAHIDHHFTPENIAAAEQAIIRVRALAQRIDNDDSYSRDLAVANLVAQRPAFWSTARYHNASAGIFRAVVNELASIKGAIEECRRFYVHSPRDWARAELLDDLLPLNPQAVRELIGAYQAIGTFRTAEELMARTEKAEGITNRQVA